MVHIRNEDEINKISQEKEMIEKTINVIKNLKPGLSQIIIHLGKDEPELKEITVDHPNFDYRWRQKDHDIMNSKEFKNLLKENDIKLISWLDLKKAIL